MSDRAESGTVTSASRRSDDCEFQLDIVYELDLTGCSSVIAIPSSDDDETRLRCGTREVEQPSSLKLTAIRKGAVHIAVGSAASHGVSIVSSKLFPLILT